MIRMNVVRSDSMGGLVLSIAVCTGLGNGAVPEDLRGRGTPQNSGEASDNGGTLDGMRYARAGVFVRACIRLRCLLFAPLRLSGFLDGW